MKIVIDTEDQDQMSDFASAMLLHTGDGNKCKCGFKVALPFLPQAWDFYPVAVHIRDEIVKSLMELYPNSIIELLVKEKNDV